MARRRSTTPGLLWALLVSLLINHGVVLPGAYLLLTYLPKTEEPPTVVEVALVPQEPTPEVEPPAPLTPDHPLLRTQPERPRPRQRPKKKKEEKKKVAEKKKEPEKKKEKKLVPVEPPDPTLRLKMVEVNNPETELPPDSARFLSDKNRRVEQETRARHTNLVKDHPRPEPLSKPSPRKERQPGAREHRVAEQREQRARERRRQQKRRQRKASPMMTMRSPLPPQPARPEQKRLAEQAEGGQLPPEQRAQPERRRSRRLQLQLDHRSLDRIDGESARKQRELARLSPSTPRGRHDRKWERIRSSLENFIPEVRPGNQTALGTRAHPFALYIARMHRRIHQLWGYGFLVDMDNKPDGHPMNNMRLWTMIEVVVKPSGEVAKATIVKPSGILPYDVAALDTVFSASPYPPSPRAIRSADGNVYLHWRFHRDQRQCGTFGVDPFILTTPPKGPIDGDMSEVAGGSAGAPRRVRRLNRAQSSAGVVGQATGAGRSPGRASAKAAPQAAPLTARERAEAARLARGFIAAFRAGDARAMAGRCGLPFQAQGKTVARSSRELARMFGDLIREAGGGRTRVGALMTPMQARQALGQLPAGADYGARTLIGRAELGGTSVILLLQHGDKGWRVTGLNR